MKHLKAYIESENFLKRFMSQPEFRIEVLDQTMADELFSSIECDLSPENLCCDGELSDNEVRTKKRMLDGAHAQLLKMGFVEPKEEPYVFQLITSKLS